MIFVLQKLVALYKEMQQLKSSIQMLRAQSWKSSELGKLQAFLWLTNLQYILYMYLV